MANQQKKNAFYVIFSLLFFSTTEPFVYANIGIDPSWTESLVMAINGGFIFGKDFIFNYGPLGYLNTGLLPESVSPWLLFIFHLFILSNYLFILKLSFDNLGKGWWKGALIAIVIFLPWGFFADVSFTLFYFLIFWLLYTYYTKKTLPLLLVIFLAVLIFYIKVNLSLLAYSALLLSLLYFAFKNKINWRTALNVVLLLGIFTVAMSYLLNVSILDYLGASLKIIDAYQDGQAVNILTNKELIILLSFEALIVGVVLFFLAKNLASFSDNAYLYLVIAFAWFLCFKQAHTATGHYNVFGFFLFLPVLALLIFLFAVRFENARKMVFLVVIIQLVATQFIRFSYTSYNVKNYVLFFFPEDVAAKVKESKKGKDLFLTFKHKNPVNYFQKILKYDYENNFSQSEIMSVRGFPKPVLENISNHSIDIIPWEVSYLFLNKLNYNPRPIIQTYQANSDWLADQNEKKYRSKDAPDIVLANIKEYREQNPFWMDKGAYLGLLKNFRLADTINMPQENLYLFEKRELLSEYEYEKVYSKAADFKEEILIPNDELVYLKSDIEYNIFGKISRLFFQPPYLRCTVTYEDESKESFRIPPPILRGGIFVNQRVVEEAEFLRFYTKEGEGNRKIKSLNFWSKMDWGFHKKFEYTFEKVK